eukprot:COSAG01_NODE_5062_length_4518_cov_2.300294_2_plen_1028_part_00
MHAPPPRVADDDTDDHFDNPLSKQKVEIKGTVGAEPAEEKGKSKWLLVGVVAVVAAVAVVVMATTSDEQQQEGGTAPPAPAPPLPWTADAGLVTATLTLSMDVSTIPPGSPVRTHFEAQFRSDVAQLLGGISVERVVILSIESGSLVVSFVVLPSASGAALPQSTLNTAFGAAGVRVAGVQTVRAVAVRDGGPDLCASAGANCIGSIADGVVLSGGTPALLPVSSPGTLVTLHWVLGAGLSSDCLSNCATDLPVSRSYEGHDWEGVGVRAVNYACSGAPRKCYAVLPSTLAGDFFKLTTKSVPAAQNDALAARFLLHTTFGPTLAEIQSLAASFGSDPQGAMASWVASQMTLPPTLHRARLRRGVNPPLNTPGQSGGWRQPCDAGSRWVRYAFTSADVGSVLGVTLSGQTYSLSIDDEVRTEVPVASFNLTASDPPYTVCKVENFVGGAIVIGNETSCEKIVRQCNVDCGDIRGPIHVANPQISFATSPTSPSLVATASQVTLVASTADGEPGPGNFYLAAISGVTCSLPAVKVSFMKISGIYYAHNHRMLMVNNTLTSPRTTPTGVMGPKGTEVCTDVRKTFLNRETCVRRPACGPTVYSSAMLTLNASTIRKFYEISRRFVFSIDGLTMSDTTAAYHNVPPCDTNKPISIGGPEYSWRKSAGACTYETPIADNATVQTLRALLTAADPGDAAVVVDARDLPCSRFNRAGRAAAIPFGANITAGGSCYSHTNYDNLRVYDFSSYVDEWQLDPVDFTRLPDRSLEERGYFGGIYLKKVAGEQKSAHLVWPKSMQTPAKIRRWRNMKDDARNKNQALPELGILGATVDFADLPASVQTPELAAFFGSVGTQVSDGSEACGSPGEVANVPTLGHQQWFMRSFSSSEVTDEADRTWTSKAEILRMYYYVETKRRVFYDVALNAPDQLRQRMAWAMSQIWVVGEENGLTHHEGELWTAWWDIFTRNAFGNMRDVLKEVAYSPLMSTYLTFWNSGGFLQSGSFPDENFSREFMVRSAMNAFVCCSAILIVLH